MSQIQLSVSEIVRMIDVSAVQAPHGETEIRELVAQTKKYGFGSIHVLPSWIEFTKNLLFDKADVLLGAPVGFPSGGNHTTIKQAEAQQLVTDGVDELDMMLNIGKLLSGDHEYVLQDIRSVVETVDVPVKVILETHYLTDDQKRTACKLCIDAGADYVKTSTGWAASGATVDDIALLASCAEGKIDIKAAGGIRDLSTLVAMYKLGARRFGINANAAVSIIEEHQQTSQ